MKKAILTFVIILLSSNIVFAETADKIMTKAYEGFDKIKSFSAKFSYSTKETGKNKNIKENKSVKSITFNKDETKNAESKNKTTVTTGQNTADDKTITKLYPECLFNIKEFLSNYELSIREKDERIKMGSEEIIAIPKGQKTAYPQIRVLVAAGKVMQMKFYDMAGKKYYDVKVNTYEKQNGIDMPVDIDESIISANNRIDSKIEYAEATVK